MHCLHCGYALWQLTSSQCPECGTAFSLRQYRFKHHAVAFECPSCHERYPTRGLFGWPFQDDDEPCAQCGELMDAAHMPVVPLTDDLDAAIAFEAIPWTRRQEKGLLKAWWETTLMVWSRPQDLGRVMPVENVFAHAYWYAALTMLAASAVRAVWGTALTLGMAALRANQMGTRFFDGQLFLELGQHALGVLFAFITPLIVVGLLGGVAHLILHWSGGTRARFNVTAATVLYAHAPLILLAVPFCDIAWYIWMLVAAILIIQHAQRVSGLRATLAVLALPVILIVVALIVVAIVVVMFLV
jgi:predicted RNA-binding Zn-ribbon protein involved in translation (DUF1610 family)